jgi:hypothetical protein
MSIRALAISRLDLLSRTPFPSTIRAGIDASLSELASDWTLTREMVHLVQPVFNREELIVTDLDFMEIDRAR